MVRPLSKARVKHMTKAKTIWTRYTRDYFDTYWHRNERPLLSLLSKLRGDTRRFCKTSRAGQPARTMGRDHVQISYSDAGVPCGITYHFIGNVITGGTYAFEAEGSALEQLLAKMGSGRWMGVASPGDSHCVYHVNGRKPSFVHWRFVFPIPQGRPEVEFVHD